MTYLYLVIFLAVFAWVAWRNFRVSLYLVLMFLPAYVLRFDLGPFPTNLIELLIAIAGIVWLIRLWRQGVQLGLARLKPYAIPVALLFSGLAVGMAVSADKITSLGVIKGWFLVPVFLGMMLASSLKSQLHIKKSITALMMSGLFLSAYAIYQVASGNFVTIDGRASAMFSSANYLSLYLVPIMLLGAGLFMTARKTMKPWIGLSLAVMLVALYFSFSYGGWIALIGSLAILAICFLPFWPTVLGASAVAVTGVISQWQHPKFQQMLDLVGRSSSSVRLEVWSTSWLMIKEHYFWGIGLGLFEKRYPEFVNRLYSPPLEPTMLHAHNLFMHFLINTGVLGLLGFLGVVIIFFKHAISTLRAERSPLLAGTVAAMSSILIHGLVDTPYWKNDLAILFWVIVAFGIILSQNVSAQRPNLSDRD